MAKIISGPKIFPFLSLVLFGRVKATAGVENICSTWRQPELHAAENRALSSFTYTKISAGSRVICGRECSLDEQCKSINFYQCTELCELSSATRAEHPDAFGKSLGGVYFDRDGDTPLFSLAESSFVCVGNCKRLLQAGFRESGVYVICPEGLSNGLEVYCDMETDGGGWIVFQRRQDGSEDFFRNWTDYKFGFGDLRGEFWLGNENLVSLTSDESRGKWELHVDLEDWDGRTGWAKYTDFKLSQGEYILNTGQYNANSTAGNSLGNSDGRSFSTTDNDNDQSPTNCAQDNKGAWWFVYCGSSNLNGQYKASGQSHGIFWSTFKGFSSLKKCSMKMRGIVH